MDNKKIKISLVLNIIIVVFTIIACIIMFTGFKFMEGDLILETTKIGMFKFFTVDSNILMGIVAFIFSIQEIRLLKGKVSEIPLKTYVLKLMGNEDTKTKVKNEFDALVKNDIKTYFNLGLKRDDTDIAIWETDYEKDHGRIEKRVYYLSYSVECISDKNKWKSVKAIGRIDVYRIFPFTIIFFLFILHNPTLIIYVTNSIKGGTITICHIPPCINQYQSYIFEIFPSSICIKTLVK